MKDRGETIDRITIANELMKFGELETCDGITYLVSLDNGIPMPPNLGAYARIVKDKALLRRIIFTSQHMMNRALLAEESPKEILNGARDTLLSMGVDDSEGGPQNPEQIIQDMGGISKFLGPQEQGLYTGFSRYDEMTGGLHAGESTIIAARPGAGKSAMALNIAQHVTLKLEKTVMFFSLEMSKAQLLRRLVCATARVDSQRVRMNYLNQEERRKLASATSAIATAKLYVDDKSAATVADLYARIRRQNARGPVDLVIVDYLQLMSAGRKFENRNQEVTYISRRLKLMTSEIGIPVIALSQLNRATEARKGNNRPQLSDLRESGSIEQDADNVAFIFREEMYTKDREDLRGLAELIIAKQRSGPTGVVKLVFLHQLTKFENRTEDVGQFDTVEPLSFGSKDL
jgi:replicative DNA helicase